MRLLDRILGRAPSTNGGPPTPARKGVSLSLAPNFEFFSPDGANNATMFRVSQLFGGSWGTKVTRQTAYAAVAYSHAAIRWRAKKLAEAPLMVVREDDEGVTEWLPNHRLAGLLDEPSPDYDMGELLTRTQAYIDITGSALWLIDKNGLGGPGRLTPYAGTEFSVRPARGRIRGIYQINTANGTKEVGPERVVYFHELDPNTWDTGLSLLDVALQWLDVGEAATGVVKDLFSNALFPSVVVQTDPEWDPGDEEWEDWKRLLDEYALPGRRGKPLALTGGGSATVVSRSLKEMVPGDVLDRVETIVSAVFGVPAIVLQFHVGLQNSPWSQMAQARRMGYEDTIEPLWREHARRITRQLLRPVDDDPSHSVAFDTSQIRALQPDRIAQTGMAKGWADIASTNERRVAVGLEPSDDPEHDEIPPPSWKRGPAPAPGDDDPEDEDVPEGDAPADDTGERRSARPETATKALAQRAERKVRWQIFDAGARGRELGWALAAQGVLDSQRMKTQALMTELLREAPKEALANMRPAVKQAPVSPSSARAFLDAIESLSEEWRDQWKERLLPLIQAGATEGVAAVANELGIRFDLLQPGIQDYVQKHAADLVTQVSETTKQGIRDAVQAGLEKGEGIPDMSARILEGGHFAPSRANLIARTESTGVTNGSGTEALQSHARAVGAKLEKSWLATPDERTRDSHAALDDLTWIPVDEPFRNGLQYPGDPKGAATEVCNCRCTTLHRIAED